MPLELTKFAYLDPVLALAELAEAINDIEETAIADAPVDGQLYGRMSAAWAVIPTSGSGGVPDAPSDGQLYGRQNAAWLQAYSAANPAGYQTAGQVTASLSDYLPLQGGQLAGALGVAAPGVNFPGMGASNASYQFAWSSNRIWPYVNGIAQGPLAYTTDITVTSVAGRTGAVTLTHADITDWTATLAPYALIASVPVASSILPVMDGAAMVGTGLTWARADHAHPSDTTRYAASNPSGFQTAAQVTTSLNSYLPLAGGTLTGNLNGTTATFGGTGTFNGQAITVTGASAVLNLTKNASGGQSTVSGGLPGSLRWQEALGDITAESGGNAGSNYTLSRFNDAGASLGPALTINRASGLAAFGAGATFGGIVTIQTNLQAYWTAGLGAVFQNLSPNCYINLDPSSNFNFTGSGLAYKAGGGSWTAPSDERIKTVLGDYAGGLDEVLRLRPVSFVYKGNDTLTDEPGAISPHTFVAANRTPFVGFIAQELETVFPDMVHERAGFIDGAAADIKNVDSSALIYALVNAVKTLKAEIDALKAQASAS